MIFVNFADRLDLHKMSCAKIIALTGFLQLQHGQLLVVDHSHGPMLLTVALSDHLIPCLCWNGNGIVVCCTLFTPYVTWTLLE